MGQPKPSDRPPITDRLLRSWLRCHRRAWLDLHGEASDRLWTAHRSLQLEDQYRSFAALVPKRPRHGQTACAEGAEAVVGLRLRAPGPEGLALEAHPPLLQRVEGPSRWGGWAYRPVLARQGRRLTREHRLVLSYWGRLLAQTQQGPVSHALVVATSSGGLEQERLALTPALERQLDTQLLRLAEALSGAQMPPLTTDRKKCTLCSWRGYCGSEATAEGHLSEVSGIGAKRRELLLELGLTRLTDLAAADPEQLAEALQVHGEQHREVAAQLVAQAQVQCSGAPRRLGSTAALPELADVPGVLIYDIESDPDARDDFLHGFLRLGRGPAGWDEGDKAPYHPLLALYEHGEARLWQRLQHLLARYPGWPLLHYGETESIALVRLAQRQGAPDAELEALRARCIDLHQRVRRHWLLPVNSYGLKAVAGWLGFQWSQKGVDGARCLLWWRQWRSGTGNAPRGSHRQLRRIFRYNHDDGLATWRVAQWLLEQDIKG
ncbi:TM0106 family RecB-like putative nuclease [Cyanobium sp. Morenito 9A2]|uniref:TM0106 family RecB-like putative nuclease n=1 Tax=Cyanobium sp. Morenito 9A2 TaxID=2823718 RepID=UPI0020CDE844|nr:TM0106 family RecB-like putative nuclease [Cyanobium sp. Morenito 9A2]MCP9849609.1 TM0106 family RecB-like putative nuclease [Cyanobium sp. Morenito 9A2]